MKILVLGANGMLGHKIVQVLKDKFEVFGTILGSFADIEGYGIFERSKILENIDAASVEAISGAVDAIKPDYLINCVGIIKQKPTASNVAETIRINSLLPHELAEIAERTDAKLITISTDCVFDGVFGMYSEDDLPNARDLYGKSKHLGEVTYGKHLTIRTSIIGRELNTSHSLIEWFLSNEGGLVKGFSNAVYTGFPTIVFADIICDLITNQPELSGVFHISSDPINKHDLLQLVKSHFGIEIEILKDETFRIDRSLDSSRFREITGFVPKTWDEMIRIMANDSLPYSNWR